MISCDFYRTFLHRNNTIINTNVFTFKDKVVINKFQNLLQQYQSG